MTHLEPLDLLQAMRLGWAANGWKGEWVESS
jgi:hypothetical protein